MDKIWDGNPWKSLWPGWKNEWPHRMYTVECNFFKLKLFQCKKFYQWMNCI